MPFTFFDCESTGIDPANDRIIQIAVVQHMPEGGQIDNLYYINPGRPIPTEVQKLTNITDEDVAGQLPFEDRAQTIADLLKAGPLVGFGCNNFDVPLLDAEFERAGIEFEWPLVIDAGELFKIKEPRTLEAALRFYCDRLHPGAHGALADSHATAEVFLAQLKRYGIGGYSAEELTLLARHGRPMVDPAGKLALINGVVCFNTHRNRGLPILDDIGYAEWMLRSDFPASTKRILKKEIAKMVKTPLYEPEEDDDEDDWDSDLDERQPSF